MKVLTVENKVLSLNNLPENTDEDIRFAVLDNSDPTYPDFYFVPLIFLESFSSPAMLLEVAGKEILMPVDWCIVVGDQDASEFLEVLPLTSINDRGFDAFIYNPLSSFRSDFGPIKILNFYNEVKWYFPKVKSSQLIAIPLADTPEPPCAFFVKEVSRQYETIDYTLLL